MVNSGTKKNNRNMFRCKESRESMVISADFTLNSPWFSKGESLKMILIQRVRFFFKFCLG